MKNIAQGAFYKDMVVKELRKYFVWIFLFPEKILAEKIEKEDFTFRGLAPPRNLI